ncbi:hypothetical protein GC176_12125 [bacterium]|nr:hypothetical protein [bacterium]
MSEAPQPEPRTLTLRTGGPLIVAWGLSVWLVLQLQYLPSDSLHSICGPWGCGPPLSVLVACHGFWVVILGPPLVAGCSLWNPGRQVNVGITLTSLGLLTLTGFGVWEATHWLQQVSEFQKQYFLQRWMFVVGTLVEIPIVETTFCGIVLTATGRWSRESKRSVQPVRTESVSEEQTDFRETLSEL